ncbi:MAG: methyltransferase domain-containing protein [Beijerinckiaceae bacterium]
MSRIVATSGDLLADRRFDYAQAEAREGNHAAAADLLQQVIELTPHWAPAWFALGDAQAEMGTHDDAVRSFTRCADLDPEDVYGARVALAALGAAAADRPTISSAYVRDLFDQYADRFDRHLTKNLGYRGPELVRDAIVRACALTGHARMFGRVLDLGCGTGLFADAFADHGKIFDGVDVAPRMIEKAKKRGHYATLKTCTIAEALAAAGDGAYDLVAAVDVFVYIGALEDIFAQTARVLRSGGLFAFTVQTLHEGRYVIGADRRYWHTEPYLRQCAQMAGMTVVLCEANSTRMDRGEPVPSLIVVCEKPVSLRARPV